MKNKRIVITGIGVVSLIGIGKDEFWKNLLAGRSNFNKISLFDTRELKVDTAGEIKNFDAATYLGKKGLRDFDRSTRLLCSAAKLAIDDSNLQISTKNNKNIGASIGTTFGSVHSISEFHKDILKNGPKLVNPSAFPNTVMNAAAGRLAIKFNLKGPNATLSNGACSFGDALDFAMNMLKNGHARSMLVGATQELSFQIFYGFHQLGVLAGLSKNKIIKSCPFDSRRNGVILAEGAVVFVLERLTASLSEGKNIYAAIKSISSCYNPKRGYCDKAMAQVMIAAMKEAKLNPQDIDCIFANANSTQQADALESKAIKKVFGRNTNSIPVTAIKSILGETYSASGGFNLAAAIGTIKKSIIAPTINYQQKDSQCDLSFLAKTPQKVKANNVLLNEFDCFGANNTTIITKFK